MVDFATYSDLRRINAEMPRQEAKRLVESAERRSPKGSTFLSHSSQDTEFLPAVIQILEAEGATVYVDKKDSSLPPYTSRDTALALRQRIEQCRCFVLFATPRSHESRWVPWELGIADGLKRGTGVAILPAAENASETAWAEREYMGVYDRIVWGELEGFQESLWMVLNQERNSARTLKRWLEG